MSWVWELNLGLGLCTADRNDGDQGMWARLYDQQEVGLARVKPRAPRQECISLSLSSQREGLSCPVVSLREETAAAFLETFTFRLHSLRDATVSQPWARADPQLLNDDTVQHLLAFDDQVLAKRRSGKGNDGARACHKA